MSSYFRLVALARREAELIAAGDLEGLVALNEERDALVATLPGVPPPGAKAALTEAQRLVTESTAALAAAVAQSGDQLNRLGTNRRAAAAYLAAGNS
jgi:hypothetical protein